MATGFHIEVTDSSNNEFPSLISTNMFISTNTMTNSLNVTIKFYTIKSYLKNNASYFLNMVAKKKNQL